MKKFFRYPQMSGRSNIIENYSLIQSNRANNISNFLPPISQNTVQVIVRIERISANPFFTSSKDM